MRIAKARRALQDQGRRRGRPAAFVAIAVVAVVLAGCSSGPASTSPVTKSSSSRPFNDLYQKALKTAGGQVVLYTHYSATDQQQAIQKAFEAAYPGINLEVTGLNGQDELAKFEAEEQAGKSTADVIQYAGSQPFLDDFKQNNWVANFTPANASDYTTAGTFIKDYAYPESMYELGACYNPTMVTKAQIKDLETYKGWASPTFNGKAALALPNGGTYLREWTYLVEQDKSLGKSWLTKLKNTVNPTAFSDGESASAEVESGEYAVEFGVLNVDQIRAQQKGAPLVCARQEYTVAVPALQGLVSNAPNKAGGQLFIDWQLSSAGQKAWQQATGNLSAMNGLIGKAPAGITNWSQPKKEVTADETVVANTQGQLTQLFTQLFGAGK